MGKTGRVALLRNHNAVFGNATKEFTVALSYGDIQADIIEEDNNDSETEIVNETLDRKNQIDTLLDSLNQDQTFLQLSYYSFEYQSDHGNENILKFNESRPGFLIPGQHYFLQLLNIKEGFLQWIAKLLPSPTLEFKGTLKFSSRAYRVFHSEIQIRVDVKEILGVQTDPKGYKACFYDILDTTNSDEWAYLTLDSVALVWSENWPVIDEVAFGSISVSSTRRLYSQDLTKDFTIVAGNGAKVKCHAVVLQSHSKVFEAMMNPKHDTKESKRMRVNLSDFSEDGIKLFIRFLYTDPMLREEVRVDLASELFQLAHLYGVKWLEESVAKLFARNDLEWLKANPDATLGFYLFVGKLEPKEYGKLGERVMQVMVRMSDDIRSCERYKTLNHSEFDELVGKLMYIAGPQNKKRKLSDENSN